ncbi:sensor domain-containing diguanylate cyclase [Xylophilus sp. GOD-11R]|uniref:GGDEF domain-containing protein n=1 Tax=Xylophilus sp. GOD-11R TaxID=3089814 RepID=UPI00298CE9AC|nr:sensor domain-containing diguanylate cyclase [Xylophilus sp. GOD-11R]WPB56055.1 sensor domain-containing diguanylate cyclase [Xylophilus sp. GOD-11R]
MNNIEPDSDVYRTLLESTKAIPWKIDWATATFAYVGPQIEQLLGWKPDTWMTVNDWAERMHPDDRAWVVDFCIAQSQAGTDHEADYRALTSSGGYVWIRDVVHVERDAQGAPVALIGFMFDITEQKKTEQKLLELQRQLEMLSFQDGLTGVANRRKFDVVFEEEWAKARRTGQPLSMILFDIDCFKQYNDCYGHVQGDDCLRRVGEALGNTTRAETDFFARYGGEEFVLVLPSTHALGARAIAERCHESIALARIPHAASPVGPLVTVSIGVGTIVPTADDRPTDFLISVDRRLYRAKQEGRNRMVADTA